MNWLKSIADFNDIANVRGNHDLFDQWLKILPTDHVVPVEVNYDPQTGRQV